MVQTDESLRRRADQLSAIARISRELAASLEVRPLLQLLHDEGLRAVHADCSSIMLLNVEEDSAERQVTMAVGCEEARELSSLERAVIQDGEIHIIEDYSKESIFPPHEGVRSAMVVPIAYQGRVLGLIHLHSRRTQLVTRWNLTSRSTNHCWQSRRGFRIPLPSMLCWSACMNRIRACFAVLRQWASLRKL
jgi:GAF domain-containing protein